MTVSGDAERLLERALSLNGHIDVLVNNAARGMRFVNERFMSDPLPFWEADPEAWRLVMDTNTVGVFLMSRAVVPHMLSAGRGSIVNVTINQQTMVRRGFSPYGPSKAALEAMTEVWAQELEGTGVVINLLLPGGATATGMVPDDVPESVELLSARDRGAGRSAPGGDRPQRSADRRHRMGRADLIDRSGPTVVAFRDASVGGYRGVASQL